MSKPKKVAKAAVKKLAKKTLGDAYNKAVLPKHYGVALAANIKRGYPGRGIKVVGITGTNGKTSTASLIHRMLVEAGYNTGLMTTIGYGLNNDIKPQPTNMTSQSIEVTLSRIVDMKKRGLDWLVLEVTSQALSQFRVLGIPIDIAVMTNVTHDHLDYHRTFHNYLNAKLKLFKLADKNKKGHRLGIINSDSPQAVLFADEISNVVAYSLKNKFDPKVASPHNLKLTAKGSRYTLKIEGDEYDINCNLPGSFNVANSLAAALVGRVIGLTKIQVEAGIKALEAVEGRMTTVDVGQEFSVIVDFAHTPDSFKKVFETLMPTIKGRLITVFGATGRRDKLKRPIMGEIAGKNSDIIILTEDHDYDEDGHQIINQIAEGAQRTGKQANKDLFKILDRSRAIAKALSLAGPKDTVLLLGKGHEKTIERADGTHPWDEVGLTKKLIRQDLKGKTKASSNSAKKTKVKV